MAARAAYIRASALVLRREYETIPAATKLDPIPVEDLAEVVCGLTAFPDSTKRSTPTLPASPPAAGIPTEATTAPSAHSS